MTAQQSYEQLCERSKQIGYLGSTVAVLHWDQRTQIPPKGHPHRVAQLTFLAGMLHKMKTDPVAGELLGRVEDSDLIADSLSVEAVNVREWRRSYDMATKIPERLAVELAHASAEGHAVWEQTRPGSDWNTFKPYLKRIVSLKREEAEALGYDQEPYDALLDQYERAETTRNLQPIFERLRIALVELMERLRNAQPQSRNSLKGRRFPIVDQEAFAIEVAKRIGYDMEAGRLDVSAHPFTTGIGPGDVRITTRYREDSFDDSFFSVLHEAGHALYHQGLPLEHWGVPFCKPISLGVNESQSRMWENLVGRSKAFWKYWHPEARSRFAALQEVSLDDFHRAINEVQPGLIRVLADEVTYNIHVLLRFELEVMLTRGELDVEDLPEAWNMKMYKYLGLTPPDYSQGVMQDVHWSSGAIGYFPTYTLGNLYSAQFFVQARRDLGDLDSIMECGEFSILLGWLREKIHSQGSRYLPRALVEKVTGEDLNPNYLVEYLGTKYGLLYGL